MSDATRKKVDFIVNVVYYLTILGIAYLVFKVLGLIFPFVIAMGLVALFQPLIRLIYRKLKINQKLASVIIIALLYVGVGILIFWIVTQIIFLMKELFVEFPAYYYNSIAPTLMTIGDWLDKQFANLPATWVDGFHNIQDNLLDWLQSFVASVSQKGVSFATGFLNTIPNFFMNLIFTILLSFFISVQYDKVVGFLKNQLPEKAEGFIGDLQALMKNTIFRYGKAYLMIMCITFVELTIGFFVIGISNPVGTAAGIAIFDALPVFGTGGIMIPWIIIEFLQGNFSYAISIAVLYIIVTVVRNIIEPKIVGDQLGINPVVSLIAIYIGYKVFGAIGMITFPMLAQILLVLHQNNTIRLYKEKPKEPPRE